MRLQPRGTLNVLTKLTKYKIERFQNLLHCQIELLTWIIANVEQAWS